MTAVIEAPLWESRSFLKSAGRALMRWWNETGPSLPAQGEAFRAWWKDTYDSLDGDLWAPGDVFEQLQLYASEAAVWWAESGRDLPEPPKFVKADIVETPKIGLTFGVVAAVVALVWLLRK